MIGMLFIRSILKSPTRITLGCTVQACFIQLRLKFMMLVKISGSRQTTPMNIVDVLCGKISTYIALTVCLCLSLVSYKLLITSKNIAKTVLTLFSTRVKMSAYANSFIELAPVLDVTPQINSCMTTTNKNTHI